ADDLTDPAAATTFSHLDATTVVSRQIAERGIYPAVDPLDSTSRLLSPLVRVRPPERGARDLPGGRPARLPLADPLPARAGAGALRCRPRGPEGPPAVQGPAGHHRDPRHGRALGRRQAAGRPGAPDPAAPLAAVIAR